MGAYPKIIEFFGLPGCGKTTLCDNLVKGNYAKIGDMKNTLHAYRRERLLNRIVFFPYKILIKLFYAFTRYPVLHLREWYLYSNFIKMIVLYSYSQKVHDYNYIVSDHGIVQSFVGLLLDRSDRISRNRLKLMLTVINSLQPIEFVLCDIPVCVSMGRMRERNRNYGRLDVIKDDKILYEKLVKQNEIFSDVYKYISPYVDNEIIDMSISQVEICSVFMQKELLKNNHK